MTDVETELITGQGPSTEENKQTATESQHLNPSSSGISSFRFNESDQWTEQKVKINVGGRKFQTWESTLRKYPDTLLGCNEKDKYFDPKSREFFFDRDPGFFRHILNFYRKGMLHFSSDQCDVPYEEELIFYKIAHKYIAPCCRDEFDSLVMSDSVLDVSRKGTAAFPLPPAMLTGRSFRAKLYVIMRFPEISFIGKFVFYLVAAAIVVSVITTVVETVSCGGVKCGERYPNIFKVADTICVLIFLSEFCISLYAAEHRLKHFRSINTLIDALAILPFFVNITVEAVSDSDNAEVQALVILRVFRIFRVFKLMRISERLQNLAKSLKASAPDLMFLCFTIFLGVLIFSSLIFYLEQMYGSSNFPSIPAAMWFGAQTMTTLGYGDVTPHTVIGKIVAAIFCLVGILVIALPVPIIEMKQKLTAQCEKPRRLRGRADVLMSNSEYGDEGRWSHHTSEVNKIHLDAQSASDIITADEGRKIRGISKKLSL